MVTVCTLFAFSPSQYNRHSRTKEKPHAEAHLHSQNSGALWIDTLLHHQPFQISSGFVSHSLRSS